MLNTLVEYSWLEKAQKENAFQYLVPTHIFWEITTGCNLLCSTCDYTAEKECSKDDLSTMQAFDLIDGVTSLSRPTLIITGGEPLIRPDFFEITQYAVSKGLKVYVITNGTLLYPSTAAKLKEIGIDRVAVKIAGSKPITHDQFHGVNGSFERTLLGVSNLHDAGIDIQFNVTITKQNIHELDDIIELSTKFHIKTLQLSILDNLRFRNKRNDSIILDNEIMQIVEWIYHCKRIVPFSIELSCSPHLLLFIRQLTNFYRDTKVTTKQRHTHITTSCLAGKKMCYISYNGKIQPCKDLDVSAGTVTENSFKQIWNNSELFNNLRNPSNLQGKCGGCAIVNSCAGGCRALAYHEYGNYLAEEPDCTFMTTNLKLK